MKFRAEVIVRSSKYLLCSGMSRKWQSASFGRAAHFAQGNSPPTVGAVNYASKHTRAYASTDKKTSHSLLYQLVHYTSWFRNSSGLAEWRGGTDRRKKRDGEQELSFLIKVAAFSISRSRSPVTKHSTQLNTLLSQSTWPPTNHCPPLHSTILPLFLSFFPPFLFHSISFFLISPAPCALCFSLSVRMDGLLAIH